MSEEGLSGSVESALPINESTVDIEREQLEGLERGSVIVISGRCRHCEILISMALDTD